MNKSFKANRLINSGSPYLKQHAYNPVDWYAWGDEALEKAKKEDKPLLISIGYSACHWCHVMERESFEDEATAAIMNAHFVCIKVDREERPDIDQLYMLAVQLMSNRGGWPLNVFALPDGRPIYGGTYFPKDKWQQVLQQINKLFETERKEVEEYAENLKNGIRQSELFKQNRNK
ncbi:MAG: thioredoxin domain-containing protein [Bacteroidia bacterium]